MMAAFNGSKANRNQRPRQFSRENSRVLRMVAAILGFFIYLYTGAVLGVLALLWFFWGPVVVRDHIALWAALDLCFSHGCLCASSGPMDAGRP
jgi:hypothetical protein